MSKKSNILTIDSGDTMPAPKKKFTHSDGWSNVFSGLGGARDKRTGASFTNTTSIDAKTAIELYAGEGLIRSIIDILPDDATREWGYVQGDPTDEYQEGIITHWMKTLDVPTKFKEAMTWARLEGGSLIYVGVMGAGSPESPLKPERIKDISYLKVFDLGSIKSSDMEWDVNPNSPTFGQVLVYPVTMKVGNTQTVVRLHASRCIPFFGDKVPPSSTTGGISAQYWGQSKLVSVYEDIRDFRGVFGSVSNILQEFIVGKYKFDDLDEMLASGNAEKMKNRIAGMEATKSSINAIFLGSDEEYTRDAATVTGIPDVLDRFMMLVSAVTRYPVTKLFGRSASGLNATGEGDLKNYYDLVRSTQNELTPYMQKLGAFFMAWLGIQGTFNWVWNPLFQLTAEQEQNAKRIEAETFRTISDADQRYMVEGVITPEELAPVRYAHLLDANKMPVLTRTGTNGAPGAKAKK